MKDSALPTRKNGKLRWVAVLLGALAAIAITVASCGMYSVYKMRGILVASGYTESWEEGVDGETVLDTPYDDKDWNYLDVYYPRELAPEKSRSAFVYVHGGAWVGGSRGDMRAFARRMTKQGYVTASVEYMLYKEGQTSSFYTIFAVLDEIDAALAKLKEVAAERGIELDRVALGGDSAGGHIISLYAYSRGKTAPIPVVFIAPRVAPIDNHVDAWDPVLKPGDIGKLVQAMNRSGAISAEQMKNPDEKTKELIDACSPLAFLTAENAIPTVSAYGGKDPLVGTKHCAKLKARFQELGAKGIDEASPDDSILFDCVEFPHSGHMLERDPGCALKFHALVLKYAERYLNEGGTEGLSSF
ncbi:MAG: alpha/beta hydrolase [Thermoguttaceae bacterium]|nr:alpha/beta hydrolase [Thermoguttaceae bacterium]